MKTKLQVSVPGEPDRHYPVNTRAIVGKGPTADVSLDSMPNVVKQHFRIKLGPNDVDVKLAPGASPLTYDGRPFAGGAVPYGSDFYLDRVRFSVVSPRKGQKTRVFPLLIAGAIVLLGLGALSLFRQDSLTPRAGADDTEIELFGEAAPCPDTEPTAAARKGASLELAAQAKRERYRYAPHDGLDAGRLYAEASKCFAAAGDTVGRDRTEAVGRQWRQRVSEEFRAARLRMRTATQNGQLDVAHAAVISMRRMLEGESMPYAAWLANEERRLRLELENKEKKKKK